MTRFSLLNCELRHVRFTALLILIALSRNVAGDEPNDSKHSQAKSPEIIASQLVDPQDGVAIAGAWNRVEATLKDVVANKPVKARYTVPGQASQRFLGFVEGLLRVSLPNAFSQNLTHAEIIWNGHIRFPIQQYSPWSQKQGDHVDGRSEMPTIRSGVEDGKVIVRVATGNFPSLGEDGVITLPDALSKSIRKDSDDGVLPITSAVFRQGRVFLAVSDRGLPGGHVYCVQSSTGEVLWSKQFADYAGASYKGSGDWFTALRIAEKELIMFHCCESSFGIEGISFEGKPRFAFSSIKE